MPILKEFKNFAMRGNVIDMAVGVVIGGAFGKIVSSLVSDIIMPPIGMLIGGVNFTELVIKLRPEKVVDGVTKAAVTLNYGSFLQTTLDFLIIAFAIFFFVRGINKLTHLHKEKEAAAPPPPPPPPSKEEVILTEIRDILKEKS